MRERWMLTIMMILVASAVSGSVQYGGSWSEECTGSVCTRTLYSGPVAYLDNGVYLPINGTAIVSDDPLYDYQVKTGIYHVYYKSDPTEGQVVKYMKDGVEVTFQPMALNYRNDLNQLQQIKMIESVTGAPDGTKFKYANAYGQGIDLEYIYYNDILKEQLVIDQLSSMTLPQEYIINGGNATLDLDFILSTNAQHIVIEGADWDKSTSKLTQNEVYIKDDEGNVLYYLPKPYAYDSNGSQQLLKYQFKKSGSSLYVIVKTPHSWLNNTAVYPVQIDPTITLQDADSENLNDAWVSQSLEEYNFGASSWCYVSNVTNKNKRCYLMFNLDSVPNGLEISSVTLDLFAFFNTNGGVSSNTVIISAYNVTNNTWEEGNGTGTTGIDCSTPSTCNNGITWNSQPTLNSLIYTNDSYTVGTIDDQWLSFNITSFIKNEYDTGQSNVTIGLAATGGGDTAFSPKESTNASQYPKLILTYSSDYPVVSLNAPNNNNVSNKNVSFNCSAISSNSELTNISLWGDFNGTWMQTNITDITGSNVTTYTVFSLDLTAGTFVWNCQAYNDAGYSDFNDINYSITVYTDLPNTTIPTITPATAYTDDNLVCSAILEDTVTTSITAKYKWYNSTTLYTSGTRSQPCISSVNCSISTLSSTITTKGESWKCEVTPNDIDGDGIPQNSTFSNISNSLPIISAVTISPSVPLSNDTLTFTNSTTDVDSDSLTYSYIWYVDGVQNTTFNNVSSISPGNLTAFSNWTVSLSANDGVSWTDYTNSSTVHIKSFNGCHINFTYAGTTYMDTDILSNTNESITIYGYCDGGNVSLSIEGVGMSNPITQTYGYGAWAVVASTSGNDDYVSNSTTQTMTINIATGEGTFSSGGGGAILPEYTICNWKVYRPLNKVWQAWGWEGYQTTPLSLQLYNNATISYDYTFRAEGLNCTFTPEELTINGGSFGLTQVVCAYPAKNQNVTGKIVIEGGGCDSAINVKLISNNFGYILILLTGQSMTWSVVFYGLVFIIVGYVMLRR